MVSRRLRFIKSFSDKLLLLISTIRFEYPPTQMISFSGIPNNKSRNTTKRVGSRKEKFFDELDSLTLFDKLSVKFY